MQIILWQYEVKPEHRPEFEAVYGPNGDWATLFSKSPAYYGTTLLKPQSKVSFIYLTLDCWDDEAAFLQFKTQHAEAYLALDTRCEVFTTSEKRLGIFEPLSHQV